jgi:putative acetyltransferase
VIVRREQPVDRAGSRAAHAAAFDRGDGEPVEARLLDALRACDGWLPAMSWVAESDEQVVGHNVCTRGHVDEVPCVGLGPIGVLPDHQRAGIGSALMYAIIGAADAAGEPLIALLGDPGYSSRFGFVASTDLGIARPQSDWGGYFQVLPLAKWSASITGTFNYSAPFDDIT